MSGYDKAKSRMIATLICAGEDSLAERIKNNDWTALRKSSQIYSSCGSEVCNLINYDIQTLQLGMSLVPKKTDDVKKILLRICKSSINIKNEIDCILKFIDDPSSENAYICLNVIEKLINSNDDYAFIILECINIYCDEKNLQLPDANVDTLSSLNVSFV